MFVKVVDDYSDEQVESEEWPEYDEEYEVKVHVDVCLADRLAAHLKRKKLLKTLVTMLAPMHLTDYSSYDFFACVAFRGDFHNNFTELFPKVNTKWFWPYFSGIDGIIHDLYPAFEGGHLEEAQVGFADVVEVHRRVLPGVVL